MSETRCRDVWGILRSKFSFSCNCEILHDNYVCYIPVPNFNEALILNMSTIQYLRSKQDKLN